LPCATGLGIWGFSQGLAVETLHKLFSNNRKLQGQAEWNGPLYELKDIEFTFCEVFVNL
jgi:hypothetical protein